MKILNCSQHCLTQRLIVMTGVHTIHHTWITVFVFLHDWLLLHSTQQWTQCSLIKSLLRASSAEVRKSVSLLHKRLLVCSGVPTSQPRTPQNAKTNASIRLQVAWLNSLAHPFVHVPWFVQLPTLLQSWLRNFVFSVLVYFGLNFGWAYYIYQCFGCDLFPKQNMPTWSDMREQMWVASWSLPCYSLLPALTEEIVERGWTLSYSSISDVGVPQYIALFVMYITFVEFGVYWMHRGLHDIPAGYKCGLSCTLCESLHIFSL